MSDTNTALRTAGIIFYGLVAGCATAVVVVLGPILVGFIGASVFHDLGFKRAEDLSVGVVSLYLLWVVLGVVIGIVVCVRVWITRFANSTERAGQ